MSTSQHVVSMLGYENLLALVVSNGVPCMETQNMRLRVIDVKNYFKVLYETEFPLTPGSALQWIGFSDEGQLFTFDTDGVMRMLSNGYGNNWIPCLDIKAKYSIEPEKFYPISVSGYEVLGVHLRPGQYFPIYSDKNRIKPYKLTLPLLNLTTNSTQDE